MNSPHIEAQHKCTARSVGNLGLYLVRHKPTLFTFEGDKRTAWPYIQRVTFGNRSGISLHIAQCFGAAVYFGQHTVVHLHVDFQILSIPYDGTVVYSLGGIMFTENRLVKRLLGSILFIFQVIRTNHGLGKVYVHHNRLHLLLFQNALGHFAASN